MAAIDLPDEIRDHVKEALVEAAVGGQERLSCGADGGEAGEVELCDFQLGCGNFGEDSVACGFGFGLVAACEDDRGSGAG